MVRPLRIEYPGAVYHVTSRGDRREPIAKDDADRVQFLSVVGQAVQRFSAQVWAYCLMGNHYHLVLQTREANLSRLMRQINGVYTQRFNRRHGLNGHLFQGRFKAILVDTDRYLLAVCRYVDLNPVRAQMVRRPEAYRWSSYRALAGLAQAPDWLDARPVYDQVAAGNSAPRAAAKYAAFVAQGHGDRLWDEHLHQQIYLGDDAFIVRMQKRAGIDSASGPSDERDQKAPRRSRQKPHLSRIQSRAPVPMRDADLQRYAAKKARGKVQRNQYIVDAFYRGGHTQTAIALAFGISASTVSRVIAAFERAQTS